VPGWLVLDQISEIWPSVMLVGLKNFIWLFGLFLASSKVAGRKNFFWPFGVFTLMKLSSVEKYLLFHFFGNTVAKFL